MSEAREPVAWVYELARAINSKGEYSFWEERLTFYKPNVPSGSIRNLRPLYFTTPTPQQEVFDAREAIASLMMKYSFATGHGDTIEDLLGEFDAQLAERPIIKKEAFDAMREALEPFAEIARRVGWDKLDENDPARNGHILEAPADDIAPGAFFVLHVSDFVNAAALAQADAANTRPKPDGAMQETFAQQSAFFDEIRRRAVAKSKAFDAMRKALQVAKRFAQSHEATDDTAGHMISAIEAALAQADAANSGRGE